MRFPQVVVDLLAARKLITTRRLAKGTVEDGRGRVCSRGALGLATCGTAMGWAHERAQRAEEFVKVIVPTTHAGYGWCDVVDWNNADERTQD